jgi:2-dehydropantoate 2-reductase
VIGGIYAARLYETGCNVTLLARDKRYENLKQNGVIIKNILTGAQTTNKVPLTSQLEANDFYDLIIVTVRLDQFDTVVPVLKNNNVCPLIMPMLNNPESIERLTNELNPKHIILGFPGARRNL